MWRGEIGGRTVGKSIGEAALIVAHPALAIVSPRNEAIIMTQRARTASRGFSQGANYGRATSWIRGTMARSSLRSSARRGGAKGYLSTEQEVICFNVTTRAINNVRRIECTYLRSRLTYAHPCG